MGKGQWFISDKPDNFDELIRYHRHGKYDEIIRAIKELPPTKVIKAPLTSFKVRDFKSLKCSITQTAKERFKLKIRCVHDDRSGMVLFFK